MTHASSMSRTGALRRVGRRAAIASIASLLVVACNTDDLLKVDLDVITPEAAASVAGAQAQRAAAIRDFTLYYGFNVSLWSVDGLITDQLINGRPGFEPMDQRNLTEISASINPWGSFSGTRYSTNVAVRNMRKYIPDDATRKQQIGHLHALMGYSLTLTGEVYCNGIPFSDILEDGSKVHDPVMKSNADLWRFAIAYFDSALSGLSATDAFRNLARIGKARALVNLNQYAQGAAVVQAGGDGAGSAAVATTYVYNVEYQSGTGSGDNGPYAWIPASANMGVPRTPEGINGLDYANDPRVGNVFVRLGQDGTTPIYAPQVAWAMSINAPYPLATGREARLIEAEANLAAGGSTWLATLNALRSGSPQAALLPPLTDPGTTTARVDMIMKERAMWMYLTVHRLGDLRRLVRQYGRPQNAVFPTGPYFKGGVYGTDVNLPPTTGEHNNPEYEKAGGKCADRNA